MIYEEERIDLSGGDGSKGIPDPAEHGEDKKQSQGDEHGETGGTGFTGGTGGTGGHGMNIKIFCEEFHEGLNPVNIEIISNGGVGGNGGRGGRGGNGGAPGPAAGSAGKQGFAGKGGKGGTAGRGGNAGNIEVIFCKKPDQFDLTNHLHSKGGNPGIPGRGGEPGQGPQFPNISSHGLPGDSAPAGIDSTPKVEQLEFIEYGERVIIETEQPVPETSEE